MKFKIATICSAAALAIAASAGAASAAPLTWNFYTLAGSPASPGVDLGSNIASFSQDGQSIFVESATSSGCTDAIWCPEHTDLYAKNAGPGEQGLGLVNDPYNNNEIANPYGIYVNVQDAGHATNVQLGSVQAGETWAVWGSNDEGGFIWTELGSGTGNGSVVNFDSSLLANYDQLIVADPYLMNQGTGTSNNIVFESITTVPEPGALALFGAGLLGCALFAGRRRGVRQS